MNSKSSGNHGNSLIPLVIIVTIWATVMIMGICTTHCQKTTDDSPVVDVLHVDSLQSNVSIDETVAIQSITPLYDSLGKPLRVEVNIILQLHEPTHEE